MNFVVIFGKSIQFFDEDDVEDCYGQSFDDKYCISPGTAAQFTFSRGSNFDLGSYISGESSPAIPSQVPEIITPKSQAAKVTQKTHKFSDLDEARLNSCLDQVHEVIADLHPREVVINCIKKHNFNSEAVLNELLSSPDAPKPQRQPRQGRRVQEFPLDLYAQFSTLSSQYDDDEEEEDYGRDISKCSLIVDVPHHKLYQEYNSVGEEECSSYSSLNSGDTEDQLQPVAKFSLSNDSDIFYLKVCLIITVNCFIDKLF
ncbi:HBS1 [Acanthosepion pharaonis]|uniref:HBS1 n=1 Tax=Acanthosepion pharaonis TaxID=158019 RepID=A0A812CYZ1_ACAPH|nr:HBS1 [Sepia pharaonis]